jgi:hypothetical protein
MLKLTCHIHRIYMSHTPQARKADYLSKVAWLAGIPLQQFIEDNMNTVDPRDLAVGTPLLMCNPKPGESPTGTVYRCAAGTAS